MRGETKLEVGLNRGGNEYATMRPSWQLTSLHEIKLFLQYVTYCCAKSESFTDRNE